MTGVSMADQATCRSSTYRPYRTTGRKAEYGRFSVLPRPEIYRNLRIKDSVKIDPACGSGGMFVQAARYMHAHNASEAEQMKFRCYGVEKEPDTVKLAKMNLMLNNVRGDITEANSYYSDPYNAFGAFDYVMANPPFNVDEVSFDRASGDARFNTYGGPRNSTKSAKKTSDKKETVPNANYLWIGYFATALNEHGKAALVMANSASDAGKSEYEIRKKMIEEGVISQMVTLPSNMFSSVTLPATLWFFDKHKPQTDKKNEILFIDARNVFTQVDRAHRKFSDEQIKNLGIITRLYQGDTGAFAALLAEYQEALAAAPETAEDKETKTKAYWSWLRPEPRRRPQSSVPRWMFPAGMRIYMIQRLRMLSVTASSTTPM